VIFTNYDILHFALEIESLPEGATEKQEDELLEKYWQFMANKVFQLFRKYNIS